MRRLGLIFTLLSLLLAACTAPPADIPAPALTLNTPERDTPSDKPPVISDEGCIAPLETFAYPIHSSNGMGLLPIPEVSPPIPWDVVETPFFDKDGWTVQIMASRTYNEQSEIWLRNNRKITIYYPDSKTWKNVPAVIGDSQIYIDELFVTQDNTVFGLPSGHYSRETTKFLLSKYNEATEQFEYAPGTQEIQVPSSSSRLGPFPHLVVLDAEKNIFWVLVPDDGLYSYNPQTQVSQKHHTLPDLEKHTVFDVAYSPDGNLYYFAIHPGGSTTYHTTMIYRFEISTGELSSNLVPLEPLPMNYKIFADHSGRVWFGAFGWLEADGTWYQVVRPPLFYPIDSRFTGSDVPPESPKILMESSDKRLWFEGFRGLVWLDPNEEKWCWFTTYRTDRIIEDQEQNMWMVSKGELYRYPLNP
jgi:hypothetical protein